MKEESITNAMIHHHRRLLFLLAVLLLAAAGVVRPAIAAAPAGEAGEPAETIVMGTSPDYPPYESVDAKGGGEIVGKIGRAHV